MKEKNAIYFKERSDWRVWLAGNFESQEEVWLIYPRKSTGKTRISYNDAVEEALCFGWIDSIVKTYDEDHTMQRFSPRKPKSSYSQANKERLRWLLSHNLIHASLRDQVIEVLSEAFQYPSDILREIEKDQIAWKYFQSMSDAYKRIRIAYIDSARNRPEEFMKRLKNFVDKTRENKLIPGFGGIDKYY
ncbi:MAG: YdeI/OmpD-associated family protein [Cyclobacteriaceae bacterium]